MPTYSNISTFHDTPFSEYLKWPEYSHSGLKYGNKPMDGAVSSNIIFGGIVDAIQAGTVSNEQYGSIYYPFALKHAKKIDEKFGWAMEYMSKQLSLKGRAEHNGFVLPVKVRPDMVLGNKFLLENKITFSGCTNKKAPEHQKIASLISIIDFMGYDNQVYHQKEMSGVEDAYILMHSVPLGETYLFKRLTTQAEIEKAADWWNNKISLYGL